MKIAIPHNTTRSQARARVEQRIDQLIAQFGGHAEDVEHSWTGDTLYFRGKARGFTIDGTAEITDTEMILDAKLPMLAKPFEGKIRHTVEREAESMFRTA
jgi:hypothetical protein